MSDKMREALLAAKKIIANPHGYTETSVLVAEALIGQAAQSVPVVGEPVGWVSTIECIGPDYKKNLFGRLPIQSLQAGYYSHTALYEKPTHSIPATELASLREKAAMVDELQKRAERMQKALSDIAEWTDRYTTPGHPISTIARAAIAKERP